MDMMTRHTNTEPRHPIGVVSARTGIPQDLLRAWEKRYQAVVPGRGPTGRRLYSDADIEKLRLLKRAVAAGRRISDVASLPIDDLNSLIKEDADEKAADTPVRPEPAAGRGEYPDRAMDALEQLDRQELERVLEEAAVSMSVPDLRQNLIVPLLTTIGERWQEGSLRIVHEHLASAIVRTFVAGLGNGSMPATAPRLVITTPAGQRHELGALLAATAATEFGWNVTYLGPDLPSEEIAAAVRQINPRAVALSVIYQNGNIQVQEEIKKLRRYIDPATDLIVGGRAVSSLRPFLEDIGVDCVENLTQFQNQLLELGA
jgi:DNA-binding transcriptional MerR regulator/methylmalonyl-CoA mutase cobalamin-binding subunit